MLLSASFVRPAATLTATVQRRRDVYRFPTSRLEPTHGPLPGGVSFGSRQVQVSNMDFGDRSVIDVDDPAALGKLATMYDTVVLDLTRAHDRLFVVVAEQTVYRYAEPLNDQHRTPNPHTRSALGRT